MADRLGRYREMRDFTSTQEPEGELEPGAERARFVIQEHHATRLHWDLRLEHDGALVSWAVPNGIPEAPDENRKAVHTEDHPLEYLDFEGDIPKGNYGAGKMRIWDRGTYVSHKWEPCKVVISLEGERVRGRYALFQTGDGKDWMIHRVDPPADPAREPLPEKVVPMLARAGDLPGDDSGWAFEVKWDGVRAIAYSEPGRLRLESRSLKDIGARYPELRPLNRELGSLSAVLDGEIVAFDEQGRPSFELLQRRMHVSGESAVERLAKSAPVTYVIFDLLYADGHSLMHAPYEERRERLMELGLDGANWRTPAHHESDGAALLEATADQGLEGVVAKRLDSKYEPGRRSGCWLKVKNRQRAELAIGGWLPGEGRRSSRFGALLVGTEDDGKLRYAGRVGTGFDEDELDRLTRLLEARRRDASPFGAGRPPKGAVWVEPDLVAEVEFGDWTSAGVLRAPSFVRLCGRRDGEDRTHAPLDGAADTPPGLPDYYARIAPVLLPHLRDRPIGGRLVSDLASLAEAVDAGGVELCVPLARDDHVDRPTALLFALAPGPDAGLAECCEIGLALRGMFEQLGLEAYPKTVGPDGLEVWVPLNSEVTYERTRPFARAVAQTLERAYPDELSEDKVGIDWSRNARGKKAVAPYSLQAAAHAVSTPLSWEEVEDGGLTVEPDEMLARVDELGDLFAQVLSVRQELPSAA